MNTQMLNHSLHVAGKKMNLYWLDEAPPYEAVKSESGWMQEDRLMGMKSWLQEYCFRTPECCLCLQF